VKELIQTITFFAHSEENWQKLTTDNLREDSLLGGCAICDKPFGKSQCSLDQRSADEKSNGNVFTLQWRRRLGLGQQWQGANARQMVVIARFLPCKKYIPGWTGTRSVRQTSPTRHSFYASSSDEAGSEAGSALFRPSTLVDVSQSKGGEQRGEREKWQKLAENQSAPLRV